ncbi:MAG: phenylacetate--CoA ligase family protein [Candidatus Hydrothermarchaeota archaeon]
MFWNKSMETLPSKELRELQEKRLRRIVGYAYKNSPFYKNLFDRIGLDPSSIKKLEDLSKIPFTTKEDLRSSYPYGFLAVPISEIVRFHASSGTTGKPVLVTYTKEDINNWTELMARVLTCAGIKKEDILQLIYNYAFFTGGLGFHYGAEKIGAAVVPSGVGNTARQIMTMRDLGVTAFSSTPSYALYLAEYARNEGIDVSEFNVKRAIFGAEPWSESMRKKIEDAYGIVAYDNYGLSELCGPGVSVECEERDGMHVWTDHFLLEVVDPETGEVLDTNEEGELVFTTLTKEAMPLLRYRTGDISFLYDEDRCGCMRTHPKISRLIGRSDDMLIIRGVNVFPSQIEQVLMRIPGVEDHYQIIVDRSGMLDQLKINIEVNEKIFTGERDNLLRIKEKVEENLKNALGVRAKVNLVEPGSIPRSEGKAQRILDLRKI